MLYREAPGVPIVDLFADAPRCNPRAAAYLLAAYVAEFPPGTIFLAVVDPGVGSKERLPVIVEADGRLFVGPGNGLFNSVVRRAQAARCWEIAWQPQRLSASFHGRDLFAPVAAQLARGEKPQGRSLECPLTEWPEDLAEVVYIDHFGNAMTGLRASPLAPDSRIRVHGHTLVQARTFAEVAPGQPFWYENSNGLLEMAVNQGRADHLLGLEVGTTVTLIHPVPGNLP